MSQLIYSVFFFRWPNRWSQNVNMQIKFEKEVSLIYRWPLMILGFCILVHAVRINIHKKTSKERE